MKPAPQTSPPADAEARRAVRPVICYPVDTLKPADMGLYRRARETLVPVDEVIVPPREGRCFRVPAGHFFRIHSIEGPQVGDLNLWNANDLDERFFSGKTRALHGTHLSTGDRLWSCLPFMRPMATITHDTLDCTASTPMAAASTTSSARAATPTRTACFRMAASTTIAAIPTSPAPSCTRADCRSMRRRAGCTTS